MRSQIFVFSFVLCIAGCGDDTGTAPADANNTPDAPSPDAMIDAMVRPDAPNMFSDAGNFTTTPTPDQVFCLTTSCTTPSTFCCGAGVSFMCDSEGADAGTCSIELHCDGPEDCSTNQVCCGTLPSGGSFSGNSHCKAACDSGEARLCHSHHDCPTSAQACCTSNIGGFQLPTGYCTDPAAAPAGSMCDIP